MSTTPDGKETEPDAAGDIEEADEDVVGERQTGLCCESCDVLIATIVCDIIYIAVYIWSLVVYSPRVREIERFWAPDYATFLLIGTIAKNAVGILFAILSILGAVKYNKWLVLACGIWMYVDFIGNLVLIPFMFILLFDGFPGDITFLVIPCLGIVLVSFSCPHQTLYQVLHQGKITPENYHVREKYCCCVSQKKNRQ